MSTVVMLKAIYARLEKKRTRLRKPNGGYERPRKQLALNGQRSFSTKHRSIKSSSS